MGRLVEALATSHGFTVAGVLDRENNVGGAGVMAVRDRGIDVAIEFSTPDAVVGNIRALTLAGINAIIGTTGWRAHEQKARDEVARAGTGVVVASNFSLGANVLEAIAVYAATLLRGRDEYGAWLHEQHHHAKKDAPSGTALTIVEAIRAADPARRIDVSSTRAGHMPGTHTVAFDGPAEQIALTHLVRDRATFAHGALIAARWIVGRQGWFSMRDVLGLGGCGRTPESERGSS
jgi:4-hydroxy-tetrahydrodipicolinate reductase